MTDCTCQFVVNQCPLCAAAPEMLQHIQEIVLLVSVGGTFSDRRIEELKTLIAKAQVTEDKG